VLALLSVVILGIGGPHGIPPREIVNGSLTICQSNRVVATTSGVGNLTLRLKPGVYVLKATLAEGGGPCQTKTVKLGHKRRDVKLGCSIP
jgi:hypothetical protein